MRARKTVQYKSTVTGAFRKMPRDKARRMALEYYDNSPMTGTAALKESMNLRIIGATIEEFLNERAEHEAQYGGAAHG